MNQNDPRGEVHHRMIGILTDFGPDNHYVAQMKGRILTRDKDIVPVDITHSIRPQDVLHGAYVLRDIIEAFPPGTVFVVVVDPGVGTDRRILIVEANQQIFVLPDNGLISIVHRHFPIDSAVSVDTGRFNASFTFHGRDIMAPLSTDLAKGESPEAWGKSLAVDQLVRLDTKLPQINIDDDGRHELRGRIVYSDLFGNLISDIEADLLPAATHSCEIEIDGQQLSGIRRTFGDVPAGRMLALIGSHQRLEIAVNQGDARRRLMEPLGQDPVGKSVIMKW